MISIYVYIIFCSGIHSIHSLLIYSLSLQTSFTLSFYKYTFSALVLSHQSMVSVSESVSLKETNSLFPRSHQFQESLHDPLPIHAGLLAGKSGTRSPSGYEFMWVTGLSCLMILCALTFVHRFVH